MKLLTTAICLALATPTFAGGPVIVEEAYEAEAPRSGWIVPVVIGLLVIAAITSGGDDPVTPPPAGCKSVEC